jgi:sec-independent protein translocase protein TatB
MFEVGFTEIVLILGLALLVLGPEKLPGLAQKVGRWTGRARAMARQLRTQLEHEVTMEELAKSRPMQSASTAPPEQPPAPEDSQSAPTGTGLDPDAGAADVEPQQASAPIGDADAAPPPKQ